MTHTQEAIRNGSVVVVRILQIVSRIMGWSLFRFRHAPLDTPNNDVSSTSISLGPLLQNYDFVNGDHNETAPLYLFRKSTEIMPNFQSSCRGRGDSPQYINVATLEITGCMLMHLFPHFPFGTLERIHFLLIRECRFGFEFLIAKILF